MNTHKTQVNILEIFFCLHTLRFVHSHKHFFFHSIKTLFSLLFSLSLSFNRFTLASRVSTTGTFYYYSFNSHRVGILFLSIAEYFIIISMCFFCFSLASLFQLSTFVSFICFSILHFGSAVALCSTTSRTHIRRECVLCLYGMECMLCMCTCVLYRNYKQVSLSLSFPFSLLFRLPFFSFVAVCSSYLK